MVHRKPKLVEIVTPAGRKKYLEILLPYIQKLFEKGDITRWNVCLNTTNLEDVGYIESLKKYSFVKVLYSKIPIGGKASLQKFWEEFIDPEKIYVRMDDDIVFVDTGRFRDFINFRRENPHYFIVSANVINNGLLNFLHQGMGVLPTTKCNYCYNSEVNVCSTETVTTVHDTFLKKGVEPYLFPKWDLVRYEPFSINCFAVFGEDMARCKVPEQGELYLSSQKPKELGRINSIFGGFVVSHFSFFTQKGRFDEGRILKGYKELL